MQEIEPGKYHLVEEYEEGSYRLLFVGFFKSIVDIFIGGGIVKQRDDEGKTTYLMANREDLEGEMHEQ